MSKRIVGIVLLAGGLWACADDKTSSPPASPAGAPAVEPATGRVTSTDSMTGVPTFIWADRKPAGKATSRPANATEAARRHVAAFASYYRLAPAQAADL